jgi:nucleoside-diphosphate-sugar epimerase
MINKTTTLIGKNSFVGNYYLNHFNTGNIQEVCLISKPLHEHSFKNINSVVHLAALVHQMKGAPEKKYFEVNSDLAFETAKKAKKDGVKHFIFLSTVKVYGEFTEPGKPWTEETECNPLDPYGKSKLEGEKRILELEDDNFIVSIIRTPLVYGPGVKANMFNLMKLVKKTPIIPLGNINNKRSLTFVGNLCALIHTLVHNPTSGVFIACDGEPVSTTNLVKTIRTHAKKNNLIIPIPGIFQRILKIIKPAIHQRIFGNLEVDNQYTAKTLNHKPTYTFEDGITDMVKWFKSYYK